MKKILLITYTGDNYSIPKLMDIIKDKGITPVRFNTDKYPIEHALTYSYQKGQWKALIHIDNETHNLLDFEAIWYRRTRMGERIKDEIEEQFFYPAYEEGKRTFYGLFQGFIPSKGIFQMDPIWRVRFTDVKQRQLHMASALGLTVPRTLTTNDHNEVKRFFETYKGNIITKMQSSFAIKEADKELVVFTNAISEEDLNEMDNIRYCPMTFQENVEKKLELRATVVGNRIFTMSVDSQASGYSDHDWRRDGAGLIRSWDRYQLPADVETKLLKLMDYYQLNYGAADFILTHDDKLYFLEVNPVGEFSWMDEQYGGNPIINAIADVLAGDVPRRFYPYH